MLEPIDPRVIREMATHLCRRLELDGGLTNLNIIEEYTRDVLTIAGFTPPTAWRVPRKKSNQPLKMTPARLRALKRLANSPDGTIQYYAAGITWGHGDPMMAEGWITRGDRVRLQNETFYAITPEGREAIQRHESLLTAT